jgi:hypothetical protein
VYAPHASSLLRQFDDGVPGVFSLTVGDDGTAYLVDYGSGSATNAPTMTGAIYTVAPGTTSATDFIASLSTGSLVLYNGSAVKDSRHRVARFSVGTNGAAFSGGGRFLRQFRGSKDLR